MSIHSGFLGIFLAACLWLNPTFAVAVPALNVYVGQGQMPFADDQNGDHGMFGELMQAMCERLQRDCHFMVVPWKRVQADIARDPHGILLNLGRMPEREANFTWLLEVLPVTYVLASEGRSYDSLAAALEAGPIAVMGGTPRSLQLQSIKQPGQSVVELTDPKQAARMLRSGRILTWYEINARVSYLWRELGYSPEILRFSPPLSSTYTYIAGSPILANAQNIQAQMRQAFADMQADGSWRRILGRYLDDATVENLLAQHRSEALR